MTFDMDLLRSYSSPKWSYTPLSRQEDAGQPGRTDRSSPPPRSALAMTEITYTGCPATRLLHRAKRDTPIQTYRPSAHPALHRLPAAVIALRRGHEYGGRGRGAGWGHRVGKEEVPRSRKGAEMGGEMAAE
ncbi:MAG: hypothetical protein Q9222_003913 [Ikaeria aurantiellina]